MVPTSKPILYNGFKIRDGLTVKNRIERIYFTDVYELSDESYLYLFVNLIPDQILDRSDKYDVQMITNGDSQYVGVITQDHSKTKVAEIHDEFASAKGFECVAGMDELKNVLIADVINPLRSPENFKKFKVSIPNGIILYGPPGCGKTFIVRKLAEELEYDFFEVKHSDLATPYIHGAVGNIGKVFGIAKQNAPAIVFFDEISGLVPDRRNLQDSSSHKEEEVNDFLMPLNDDADNHILVVGATIYIEKIDPAVLRPGRFDKKIYVSPPDYEARRELFRIGLSNRPYDNKIDFDHLAEITEGLTCADIIEDIIESAARVAANLNKKEIDQHLIEEEVMRVKG